MPRYLLAVIVLCVVTSASVVASGPQGMDVVTRHYDAADVANGKVQVIASGDFVYVSGTSAGGPWVEVWRQTEGEWKKIAATITTELTPIRFGTKRDRRCRT